MKTARKIDGELVLFLSYVFCVFVTAIGLGAWKLGLIPKAALLYALPLCVIVGLALVTSGGRRRI